MLRTNLLALAVLCALACTGYGQQPSPTQAAPPAASAAPNQPAQPMTGQQSTPAEAKTTPPAKDVPMSEPVITLKGACPAKDGKVPQGCVSSITREQFEKLTNALQPADRGPVPPEVRRRFATQYSKLLALADTARELGLENDPQVQQIFTFARNQILAEAVNRHYLAEFAHPTDQQIADYYKQNEKKYHEVTLQRVIIPVQQESPDKPKVTPEEQKAYAEKIRARWAAGEDAAKLEKEAMDHIGMTTTSPEVNLGARRPGSLPEAHEPVFELKSGEVSQVYSDPAAYYIYKIVSERQVPLSEVKSTIETTLQRQMYNDKMQELQSAVTPVLNDDYFGPEQPANSGPGMRPGMPGMPGMRAGPPGAGAPPPPPAGAGAATPAPASQNTGAAPK